MHTISIINSKTLLVIIFSPPEIGHACLLSDANDFYIEQGVHFTMKNTFRRELPPGWKCIEMTFGKRFSFKNRRFNLQHEFRTTLPPAVTAKGQFCT